MVVFAKGLFETTLIAEDEFPEIAGSTIKTGVETSEEKLEFENS
jgi:hypothetical protein